MKSTFSRMGAIALTMWFGLVAGAANAATFTIDNWSGSASAGYSADFGNNNIGGTFADTYNFSLPADATGNGEANAISLGGNGIIFTAFTLFENSIGVINGTMGTSTGGNSTAYLAWHDGAVPGQYALNVAGYKTNAEVAGSYAGNVVTSPVPEPKTYAMMLLGLGLLGFSARRRMHNI